MADVVNARSWFCVFNNPEKHGFSGSPEEIAEQMKDRWIADNPQRTCAVAYCVSADGLPHLHAVFEDTKTMRFSAVQKLFPGMHIEATKGSKDQAEDYINKRGKFKEKGETVVYITRHGEIKGAQGQRRDLEVIEDLLNQGAKPDFIMSMSLSYRRYEKFIRDEYFARRYRATPRQRNVSVRWHVGDSGTGKSYIQMQLAEKYGDDEVYVVTDYEHPFDKYNGEKALVLDEFRGQMKFSFLMNLLDGYRIQLPCRYSNVYALWDEVHICTVLPPECVYAKMVAENREYDEYEQLRRRIDCVVYHYRKNSEYKTFECPMSQYTDYEDLRRMAETPPKQLSIPDWCKGEPEDMET